MLRAVLFSADTLPVCRLQGPIKSQETGCLKGIKTERLVL